MQAETKWTSPPWASFDTVVDLLLAHRRANPYLAKKNNWALDRNDIANEVDAYNAAICKAHGWTNFIDAGDILPKYQPRATSLLQGVEKVAAGARLVRDLFGEKEKPVSHEEATHRASTCIQCPKNTKGDWTRFFTIPAADVIRRQFGVAVGLECNTSHDDQLGICEACGCPLRLKVHIDDDFILARTSREELSEMPEECWIQQAAKKKKT